MKPFKVKSTGCSLTEVFEEGGAFVPRPEEVHGSVVDQTTAFWDSARESKRVLLAFRHIAALETEAAGEHRGDVVGGPALLASPFEAEGLPDVHALIQGEPSS